MKKITVLLADDHALIRMALSSLLDAEGDMEVVGQAKNGEEAVREAVRLRPDVVIMDLQMPKKNGIEATEELKKLLPETKVFVLTTFTASDGIASALAAGATGAFAKSSDNRKLIAAIRRVAAGGEAIAPEIRRQLETDPPMPPLSPRQQEVLTALTDGRSNKEISEALGISIPRVEELINEIRAKLHVSNRTEAVAIALRKQLLKL